MQSAPTSSLATGKLNQKYLRISSPVVIRPKQPAPIVHNSRSSLNNDSRFTTDVTTSICANPTAPYYTNPPSAYHASYEYFASSISWRQRSCPRHRFPVGPLHRSCVHLPHSLTHAPLVRNTLGHSPFQCSPSNAK